MSAEVIKALDRLRREADSPRAVAQELARCDVIARARILVNRPSADAIDALRLALEKLDVP